MKHLFKITSYRPNDTQVTDLNGMRHAIKQSTDGGKTWFVVRTAASRVIATADCAERARLNNGEARP